MLTARRFDRLWPSLPLYFSLSFSIALSLALALPSLPTVPQAKLQVVQFSALAARKGLLTKHAEPTSNQTGRNVGDASAMLQTHYASLDPRATNPLEPRQVFLHNTEAVDFFFLLLIFFKFRVQPSTMQP